MNDLEVNGPYWDSHVIAGVAPESDEAAMNRTRLMHQASRRVIHTGRHALHQELITALQNEVDRERDRTTALSEELGEIPQGARDMRAMQNVHRVNRTVYIANLNQSISTLQQRIRDLKVQIVQQ